MNDNGADQSARKLSLPAPFLFTCNKVRPILGFLDLCEPNYYSNSIMLLAFADIKKISEEENRTMHVFSHRLSQTKFMSLKL